MTLVILLIPCAINFIATTTCNPGHSNSMPNYVCDADSIHLTSLTSCNYILQIQLQTTTLNAMYFRFGYNSLKS